MLPFGALSLTTFQQLPVNKQHSWERTVNSVFFSQMVCQACELICDQIAQFLISS